MATKITTLTPGRPHGAAPVASFVDKRRVLTANELGLFCAKIKDARQRLECSPDGPRLPDYLAAEREAFLTIASEREIEQLSICRQKILQSLPETEDRAAYIDLLMSVGDCLINEARRNEAGKVARLILTIEPNNWHAHIQLGVALGFSEETKAAVASFEKAGSVLAEYQKTYEVAEVDLWEAAIYQGRFKAELAVSRNQQIKADAIFDFIRPAFIPPKPDWHIGHRYALFINHTIASLVKLAVPMETLAAVFKRKISADDELRVLECVGPVPRALILFLKYLDPKTELGRVSQIFEAAEAGLGNKAVTLFCFLNIERALSKGTTGEEEARSILKKLQKSGFIVGGAGKEINNYIKNKVENDKRVDTEVACLGLLAEALQSSEPLAKTQKALSAYRLVARPELREVVVEKVTEAITDATKFKAAMVVVAELSALPEFNSILKEMVEAKLAETEFRRAVQDHLAGIRTFYCAVASQMAANFASGKTVIGKRGVDIPKDERELVFDYFMVRLRNNPVVQALFAEADSDHSQPISIESLLCEAVADKTTEKLRVHFLQKALEQDRFNFQAAIKLAQYYGERRQTALSEEVLAKMAKEQLSPFERLNYNVIKIGNLAISVENQFKQPNGRAKIAGRLAEAAALRVESDALYAEVSRTETLADTTKMARIQILSNLAYVFTIAYKFETATALHEAIIAIDPDNESAIREKGRNLIKQGWMHEAAEHFQRAITNSRGRVSVYFLYFAEAAMAIGLYNPAESVVDRVLAANQNQIEFHFLKGRIALDRGRDEEANVCLRKVQEMAGQVDGKDEYKKNKCLGMVELLKAESLARRGEKGPAIAAYRQAQKYFAADVDLEYLAMTTGFSFAYAFTDWGNRGIGSNNYEASVSEFQAIIEKYPFYARGHQALFAPLVSLGRFDEAFERVQWLMQNKIVTSDLIINLHHLRDSDCPKREEAADLIRQIEAQEATNPNVRKEWATARAYLATH